jgi:hypothetical protein
MGLTDDVNGERIGNPRAAQTPMTKVLTATLTKRAIWFMAIPHGLQSEIA